MTREEEFAMLQAERDAWRAACRYLYEVIGEGGARGRPMDLIPKKEYMQIIVMIDKAVSLEDSRALADVEGA